MRSLHREGSYRRFIVGSICSYALALAFAHFGPFREAGMILLFVPLIWAMMYLSLRGMIFWGLVTAGMRVAVEVLVYRASHGTIAWSVVLIEPLFPLSLYVGLGAAFYHYRARQQKFQAQLAEIHSRQTVIHVIHSLAHDFKNILQVITGSAQLILMSEDLPESVREDAEQTLKAGRRGAAMVEQLRNFGREQQPEAQMEDLSLLVEENLGLIRRVLPMDIDLRSELAAQPLPILMDADQFQRVLLNLTTNAGHAVNGDGRVDISTCRDLVDGRPRAVLTVSDNGCGIDPDIADHLFEPFATTREQEGGSGLGLSIVRSIVRSHGGEIACESQLGEGTTFSLRFPLAAKSPRRPQESSVSA